MSRKNNVNTDHYKTAGRGRQGQAIAADSNKHSYAQARAATHAGRETTLPGARARQAAEARRRRFRLLQRLRRSAKLRGLTAKQLMERRMRGRQATPS